MIGRLIIALLVVGSAFAVMWQRKASETVSIDAGLEQVKAKTADERAAAAEKRAAEAEVQAATAEAKASYFEAQLIAEEKARHDAVVEELTLHIVEARFVGLGADVVGATQDGRPNGRRDGHFRVSLEGPGAELARLRVYGTTADGANNVGPEWDSREVTAMAILHGGVKVLAGRQAPAPSVMTTRTGATLLDVAIDDAGTFLPGLYYMVELTRGDGHVLKRVVAIDRQTIR